VENRCPKQCIYWPYAHEPFLEKEAHVRATTLHEVQAKIMLDKNISKRLMREMDMTMKNEVEY